MSIMTEVQTININQIDKNFLEYGFGLEYGLTDKLRISGGWSHTATGVNLNYQSDQSFSTNTNSFGAWIWLPYHSYDRS